MRVSVKSESGQATTEYVLLLIVSVGIVLALMTQLFRPLQTFLTSYMGDYTACLLQTGELPSLGGESSVASDEGCNSKFEPGTLANGRPPIADGGGGGAAGKSGNGEVSSGDGGGSGSGAYAGSSSRNGASRLFDSSRGTQGGESGVSDLKKTDIPIEDSGGGGSFFSTNSSKTVIVRRKKSITLSSTQLSEEVKKKLEKKREGNVRIVASEGTAIPAKKIAIKKPELKAVTEAEGAELTIGNFMRMLFIIAIVIAIVIFVGGQVLQMSKNGDG